MTDSNTTVMLRQGLYERQKDVHLEVFQKVRKTTMSWRSRGVGVSKRAFEQRAGKSLDFDNLWLAGLVGEDLLA